MSDLLAEVFMGLFILSMFVRSVLASLFDGSFGSNF
jgi:hypothetical protein